MNLYEAIFLEASYLQWLQTKFGVMAEYALYDAKIFGESARRYFLAERDKEKTLMSDYQGFPKAQMGPDGIAISTATPVEAPRALWWALTQAIALESNYQVAHAPYGAERNDALYRGLAMFNYGYRAGYREFTR